MSTNNSEVILMGINNTEVILMSTNNIGFYEKLTKIIFQLLSNTHLMSSGNIIQLHTFLYRKRNASHQMS